MHSHKEYDEFVERFLKAVREIEDDLETLTPEDKQRFMDNANSILKAHGYSVTIGETKWSYFG